MDNPVNTTDVANRWRPLTSAETTVATNLLIDAWAELLSRVPRLEERLTDGTLSVDNVRRVEAAMVKRVLINPEGVRSTTRSIDDYTATDTRDQALSAGLLYATDEEIALLSPPASISVGTIRLGTPYDGDGRVCV